MLPVVKGHVRQTHLSLLSVLVGYFGWEAEGAMDKLGTDVCSKKEWGWGLGISKISTKLFLQSKLGGLLLRQIRCALEFLELDISKMLTS
jgi:hypothetical protein